MLSHIWNWTWRLKVPTLLSPLKVQPFSLHPMLMFSCSQWKRPYSSHQKKKKKRDRGIWIFFTKRMINFLFFTARVFAKTIFTRLYNVHHFDSALVKVTSKFTVDTRSVIETSAAKVLWIKTCCDLIPGKECAMVENLNYLNHLVTANSSKASA